MNPQKPAMLDFLEEKDITPKNLNTALEFFIPHPRALSGAKK